MPSANPLQLKFDTFELDEADARLKREGQPIALAPKAFLVLCALARQPGQLMTKSALLDAVWGHQHVSESVLKTTISELRAALSDDAKKPRYIETASRRGYRFIGQPHVTQAGHAPFAIIGRETALGDLRNAWSNAASGRRQIVWIAGEAGVGKTTLIDAFINRLGPITLAHGQCVEQTGAGEPYLPVLEALGELCRNDPALPPLMRSVAPAWLVQLPWLTSEGDRDAVRRELAGTTRERMLRELAELLDRYTQQRPLLLVTEDLHWSDHATVQLIDHLARRRTGARLMWLASFRLAEVISENHPLKALRHELRLHRLCHEIVLDPFSEREVGDYIDRRFPEHRVDEHFVRVLHSHTDGLPLFVVNVIDDLVSQGALEPVMDDALRDGAAAPLQVPESLAGVIEKQIARLPGELQDLLEAASVSGVDFRSSTVADAMACDPQQTQERCDELVRQQHWLRHVALDRLPDGSLDARYAFRHAVYRHVFYRRIGAATRAQFHRGVALSLERSRSHGITVAAAELASHFELSHELMPALRYYAEAAENALSRFAPIEARALTAHALTLLPRCPESIERLEAEMALQCPRGVACSQLLGVASPEATAAFERAHAISELLPPAPERAKELSGLGWVFYVRGQYDAALALARRMQTLGEGGDRILRVCGCNLLGATLAYQGDVASGADWLQKGLAACDELGDRLVKAPLIVDPIVSMRANLCMPLAYLGLCDQARAQSDGALAHAEAIGQPMSQMLALWCAAILEAAVGTPERVLALADTLAGKVASHLLAQGRGPRTWLRGIARARMGEPDTGYALIMEGYSQHAGFGMYGGATQVLAYATEALILAGRWADAQAQVEDGLALAKQIGERFYVTDLLLLQARIALAQKHLDTARSLTLAALDDARSQQTLWQEIRALVALCELQNARREDLTALAAACARLKEGLDTKPVRRARELLALRRRPS